MGIPGSADFRATADIVVSVAILGTAVRQGLAQAATADTVVFPVIAGIHQ